MRCGAPELQTAARRQLFGCSNRKAPWPCPSQDGIETGNLIERNLAISTKASNALLNTDTTPASFWITNPNNTYRNNIAAGQWARAGSDCSSGGSVSGATGTQASPVCCRCAPYAGSDAYGYWFRLLDNPEGPSFTTSVCPKFTPLGEFSNNAAHSNMFYGLRIHPEYYPKQASGAPGLLMTGSHEAIANQVTSSVDVPLCAEPVR